MKTALSILAFLVFALLMLPGLMHPPAESLAANTARVTGLAHALNTALLDFHEKNGRYPEGDAGQTMDELQAGGFFSPARETLNDKGELLDPWGTPFRITYDKKTGRPIIQSAGRNLTFEHGHPMSFMSSDDHTHSR